MLDTLIQRYLGNKSAIADDIVQVVRQLAKPGDLVFDAFSGTLAVSAALRKAGFRVACNDINHFSWVYAQAFFAGSKQPWPNGLSGKSPTEKARRWADMIEELTAPYTKDIPKQHRRTDIFDHYCEVGPKSAFKSSRGSSGRRRFFSPENATLIDRALSRIRYRYRTSQLDERTRCVLTAALLTAIEKVSNTQGTYHDFPREFTDSRALKRLQINAPSPDAFRGLVSEHIGRAEDTLQFAPNVPKHKVLYIDPPYNFRQYTSYYFMLNLISSHAEIDDLDDFFANVEYVRGQNMRTDFKSSFCSKGSFISSLKTLIGRANTDYVVLSYFDGRNHWGQFKAEQADVVGRQLLEKFLRSELFRTGSFECVPIERRNYQSYGGYSAKPVQEFLFVARKSILPEVEKSLGGVSWIGQASA